MTATERLDLAQGNTRDDGDPRSASASPAQNVADRSLPGWQRAFAAVLDLARPVTAGEVARRIKAVDSTYKATSAAPDLCKITVNCLARGHHQPYAAPRTTNNPHEHDLLFKQSVGGSVYYQPYDRAAHGIWDLFTDPSVHTKSKLRVRRFAMGALSTDIAKAERELSGSGDSGFLNEDDMKTRVSRAIVVRRGQPKFRRALLDAYEGTCVITGCTVEDVLEAAHIIPHNGEATDKVANGLLLRADIHTLFDLGYIWIEHGRVCIAPHLRHGEYRNIEAKHLRGPTKPVFAPNERALAWHADRARAAVSG